MKYQLATTKEKHARVDARRDIALRILDDNFTSQESPQRRLERIRNIDIDRYFEGATGDGLNDFRDALEELRKDSLKRKDETNLVAFLLAGWLAKSDSIDKLAADILDQIKTTEYLLAPVHSNDVFNVFRLVINNIATPDNIASLWDAQHKAAELTTRAGRTILRKTETRKPPAKRKRKTAVEHIDNSKNYIANIEFALPRLKTNGQPNRPAEVYFLFLLSKIKAKQLDYNLWGDAELSFDLAELVALGAYSSIEAARHGWTRALDILLHLEVRADVVEVKSDGTTTPWDSERGLLFYHSSTRNSRVTVSLNNKNLHLEKLTDATFFAPRYSIASSTPRNVANLGVFLHMHARRNAKTARPVVTFRQLATQLGLSTNTKNNNFANRTRQALLNALRDLPLYDSDVRLFYDNGGQLSNDAWLDSKLGFEVFRGLNHELLDSKAKKEQEHIEQAKKRRKRTAKKPSTAG